jgi:hypothetical protein
MVQGIVTSSTLQAHVQGRVYTPNEPEYEEARLAWNRLVDQHPAVIMDTHNLESLNWRIDEGLFHLLEQPFIKQGSSHYMPMIEPAARNHTISAEIINAPR